MRQALHFVAGTTRLELATFPHLHAGRSNQIFNECFAFLGLYFIFPDGGTGTIRVFLFVNKIPRSSVFGKFRSPLIMPFKAILRIAGGSHIKLSTASALQYVNVVGHRIVKACHHEFEMTSLFKLWRGRRDSNSRPPA